MDQNSSSSPRRATVSPDDTFYIQSVPTYLEDLGAEHDDTIGDDFFENYGTPHNRKSSTPKHHSVTARQTPTVIPPTPISNNDASGSGIVPPKRISSAAPAKVVYSVVPRPAKRVSSAVVPAVTKRVSSVVPAVTKRVSSVVPTVSRVAPAKQTNVALAKIVAPPKRVSNVVPAKRVSSVVPRQAVARRASSVVSAAKIVPTKTVAPSKRISNVVPAKQISTGAGAGAGHSRQSSAPKSAITILLQPPMRFGSASQKPVQTTAATRTAVPSKRISTAASIDAGHSREQTVLKPQSTKLIQPPMRFGSTSQKALPLAQKLAASTQNIPPKRVSTAPASAIDAEHSRASSPIKPPTKMIVQPPMHFGPASRKSTQKIAALATPTSRNSVLKEVQSISSTPAASHTGPMTRRMAQLNLKAGTSGIRRAPTPVFDKAH